MSNMGNSQLITLRLCLSFILPQPRSAPDGTFHDLQTPLGHSHCCTVCSSVAAWGDLLCVVLISCKRTASSPWASVGLQGAVALHMEHLLLFSCPDLGVCRLLSYFLLLSPTCCCTTDFPFLNHTPRAHPMSLAAQHW